MEIESRYKYQSIFSKEEFIKKILLKFAEAEDVSPDLFKAEFGEVEVIDREFFCVTGEASCEFTCSVGYDREENYIEIEKKKELVNGSWQVVEKPVNKTKKVTDWQPYSGTHNGNYYVILNSNGGTDDESRLCESFFKKVENSDVPVEGKINSKVKSGAIKELEDAVESSARWKLPGDTYKNFSSKDTVSLEKVFSLIVPYYRVTYTYKGNTKTLEFCSCADFNVSPSDEERTKLNYTPVDTVKLAKENKDVVKATKIRNISWIIGIVLAGLANLVPGVGFMLSIVFIAIPIVLTFKRSLKYNGVKRELDIQEQKRKENIINERRKEVVAVLQEVYKEKGFGEITFEELYK